MPTPRGTARRERRQREFRYAVAPELRLEPSQLPGHEWDDESCCVHCGFDGAEEWHLVHMARQEPSVNANYCEARYFASLR